MKILTPNPTNTIATGGTGATTKAGAFDALSPMNAGGQLIYGGASGTGTALANGTVGQILRSAGTTLAPTWTGIADLANGTAGSPTFTFNSDPDNGMYLKTTNSIGFATAGAERFYVNSAGKVFMLGDIDISGQITTNGNPTPVIVVTGNQTSKTANIASTSLISAPGANTLYRVTATLVVTTAAGTSSTLPKMQISFTEVHSNTAVTWDVTTTNAGNVKGTTFSSGHIYIFVKSGVAVNYNTTGYLSNAAAAMNYSIDYTVETMQ